MNILGSCVRPADPQYYQCTEIFSVSSGYEIFQCKFSILYEMPLRLINLTRYTGTSEITIKDSN